MMSDTNQSASRPPAVNPGTADLRSQALGVADLAAADPREHIEPSETERPISLWLVMFVSAFFAWGGFYVQRYSGGYRTLVYNENALGLDAALTNAVQTVDPYSLGKRLFSDTCAKCHQPDGQGLAGQYPPLVGSEWVLASGSARMIRIVLDAVQGPITVKGAQFNNSMTPWRDTLTDRQIAGVITYVRTQQEWGNTASPVTPEEVAAIRKKTERRPALGPWTVTELLAIPENEPPQ
jgi:mono/diheme cytochrome c family protein